MTTKLTLVLLCLAASIAFADSVVTGCVVAYEPSQPLRPVTGATVMLYDARQPPGQGAIYTTTTSFAGTYAFNRVLSNSIYRLVVVAPGYVQLRPVYFSIVRDGERIQSNITMIPVNSYSTPARNTVD